MKGRHLVLCLLVSVACACGAEPIDWKLTYTHHRTQDEADGQDLNLRGTRAATVFWLGHYWRANELRQSRAGLERWFTFPWGKALLSGQAATRGFLGVATQAEFGAGAVRPLLGFGRTNLNPYYNLNFDPNDAITLGLSADLPERRRASFYAVHDDRLGTGQTVLHALLRTSDNPDDRWTIDLFQRRGPLGDEGGRVVRTGLGVTYDRAPYFGRVVYDPNANFAGHDMRRLGFGVRF
ncbi:MAG TPA: hypothetical protein VM183_13600 [Burkholderiales bacterium]|nr:hypothetical protein [Burkholderiales bacterium]